MQHELSGKTLHPVPNTKVAAGLLTVGVPFATDKDPVTNVYSEGRPYRPGMPGQVTYMMGEKSNMGAKTGDLILAWHDNEFKHALELDALIAQLVADGHPLGHRLADLLPLALMQYLRGGAENRDRIQDLWKKAAPMVLIRKSENSWTLIHKDASAETRAKFGIR